MRGRGAVFGVITVLGGVACGSSTTATTSAGTAPVSASTVTVQGPTTALPTTTTALPSTTPSTSTSTTIAASTTSVLGSPEPIRVESAASGEGEWEEIVSLGGVPVMWKTSLRPIPTNRQILAHAVVFDQTRLHATLYNGASVKGEDPWRNGRKVPESLRPALVATFNSGFQLRHIRGGHFSEGIEVKPLKNDQMTLAIDRSGRMTIGVYGTDLVNDGTWMSLRQNLPPVVLDGVSVVRRSGRVYWGDIHGDTRNFRSALCLLSDGRLMYSALRMLDINQLAQALVAMGCRTAMQLDINFNYVFFSLFDRVGDPPAKTKLLDPWMLYPDRATIGTDRDFIALLDPALVAPDALG